MTSHFKKTSFTDTRGVVEIEERVDEESVRLGFQNPSFCMKPTFRSHVPHCARKTTLDERETELFTAIREGKDYVPVGKLKHQGYYEDDPFNHIAKDNNKRYKQEYRNENIEHWRSKKTLKRKAVAAKCQKKRNYDDVVVTGSSVAGMTTWSTDMPTLVTKEEERRAKRLKAIDSRKLKN